MKTKTFLLFISTTVAASCLDMSCTYKQEEADKERYDTITGDSLDTSADPSIQALKNDSFARKEDTAVKTSTTENGSTTAAYTGSTTGTGSGGASEKK